MCGLCLCVFFFQAEDGIRDLVRSRGLGDVYKRQASRSLVKTPGLSGFAAAEPAGFSAFLAALLALIDIYLIWQFVLLLVGVVPVAGIARGKAWIITAIVFLLVLALRALPGFIGMQLSGLNTGGGFFYF